MLFQQYPEIYKPGDRVYLKGVRGVDPNPYKIYKCVGDGQYELSRYGRVENGYFLQENLQTKAP